MRLRTLVLLAVAVPGFGQTALAPAADRIRSQALRLPTEVSVVSLTPADGDTPRQQYVLKRTFAPDGSFTEAWQTPRFESLATFRPDGTLLNARLADHLRRRVVEQTSDPARTSLHTVITTGDHVDSDKRVALTPGIGLRDELDHLVRQAWKAGVRDGLAFSSLSPDGGLVGDFRVAYRTVADPTTLSDKYAYPAEFRAALASSSAWLVADMSLAGIASLFFPHHFYLIYSVAGPEPVWRAYFGEDPKKPVFQYLKP